ncbi:MAG: hypothetical protein [aquatic viral metagenome]
MQIDAVLQLKENQVLAGHFLSIVISRYDLTELHNMYLDLLTRKYGGRKPSISCEPLTVYTLKNVVSGVLDGSGLETMIHGWSYAEYDPDIYKEWIAKVEQIVTDTDNTIWSMGSVGGCFHDIPNKKALKLMKYQYDIERMIIDFNNLILQQRPIMEELLNALISYTLTIYSEAEHAIRTGNREALLYGTKRAEAGTGIRIGGYNTLGSLLQYADDQTLLKFLDDARLVALGELQAIRLFLEAGDPTKAYTLEIISEDYRGSYGIRSDIDREDVRMTENRSQYNYESMTREVNVLTPASALSNGNLSERTKEARRMVYQTASRLLGIALYPPDLIPIEQYGRLLTATWRYELGPTMGPVLVSRDLGFTMDSTTTPADLVYPGMLGIIYRDSSFQAKTVFIGNPSGAPTTQLIYLGYNSIIFRGYGIEYAMVLGDDAHIVFSSYSEATRWEQDLGAYAKKKGIQLNVQEDCEYTFILGTVYKYCRDGTVMGFKLPKDMKSETTPKGQSIESGWAMNLESPFEIERKTPPEKIQEFKTNWPYVRLVFLQENRYDILTAITNPSIYAKAYEITGSTGDLIQSMRS